MMQRRYIRRNYRRRAPQRRKLWIRNRIFSSAPTAPFSVDLLADWRTKYGISLQMPGTTLLRTHIKVAALVTESAFSSGNGLLFSMFNEQQDISPVDMLSFHYEERYLMWDFLYAAEEVQQSGVATNLTLYKEYDIRAKRKLQNVEETIWAQVANAGLTAITDLTLTYSMLWALP